MMFDSAMGCAPIATVVPLRGQRGFLGFSTITASDAQALAQTAPERAHAKRRIGAMCTAGAYGIDDRRDAWLSASLAGSVDPGAHVPRNESGPLIIRPAVNAVLRFTL